MPATGLEFRVFFPFPRALVEQSQVTSVFLNVIQKVNCHLGISVLLERKDLSTECTKGFKK
jgi:hypothetical protein